MAAYRIVVTKLEQEVGEILMDMLGELSPSGSADVPSKFERFAEEHWRYAQASTVASGSIEMQRILMARSMDLVRR